MNTCDPGEQTASFNLPLVEYNGWLLWNQGWGEEQESEEEGKTRIMLDDPDPWN